MLSLRDHVQEHYHYQEIVNFLNGMVTKFVMMETTMPNVNGMEEIVVDDKLILFFAMNANVWIQILILVKIENS